MPVDGTFHNSIFPFLIDCRACGCRRMGLEPDAKEAWLTRVSHMGLAARCLVGPAFHDAKV